MQLLLLIYTLIITAAIPVFTSVPFARSVLNTTNETEASEEYNNQTNQEQRICETTYCNEIAKSILQNRDTSADPCEDFYQYACGFWEKHNPIPSSELEWSADYVHTEQTWRRIRDVIEEEDQPTDIQPVRMARQLYRSCMNVDAIERRGIKPIEVILDKYGGWPIAMPVVDWDPDKVPWQKLDMYYLRLFGISAFYNLGYEIDMNNTKRYIFSIDQDVQQQQANKKDKDENLYGFAAYIIAIYRVVEVFAREKGYTLNKHQIDVDIVQMINFKEKLTAIFKDGKVVHEITDNYERMTVGDLQKWYDRFVVNTPVAKINFLQILQYLCNVVNITVDESEPIIVYNPIFLQNLAELLGNTTQRVLVNYIQWEMIDSVLPYTTEEMREIKFNIIHSLLNISDDEPRWKFCVRNIRMMDAVSYMFVKRYMKNSVLREAKMMIHKVRDELKHRIVQAHWLPNNVKRSLAQKLDNLIMQIGYPEWYKNDQAVTEYYRELQIGSDFFQNIINCVDHDFIKDLIKIREPVTRNQWLAYPITVNSYYVPTLNAITIPAAELQEPYFTLHLPDSINYGVIGFVIGHELSHSFDNRGIKFDKEGVKTNWASRKILNAYEQRTQCFIDQYNNYTLHLNDSNGTEVLLDGSLTEDENIADTMGIQAAYAAYKKIAKQNIQRKLPGLENLSSDELFFLGFANYWCSSARPEYAEAAANLDEHSPGKYRVIGSLANMPAFSKTFKCPKNSTMNRQHKCNIWT